MRARQLLGWVALILSGITVGIGLVLPKSEEQAEYSRLIAIHPPLAWSSYLAVGIAAVAAVVTLARPARATADHVMAASLEVGAVLTALTLATGSIWGRPTWGVWWQWDPRLTTEALLLAFLAGASGLRRALVPGRGRAVVTSVISLATVGLLPIVHFSVEWWRSLHQRGTLGAPSPTTNADDPYLVAMLIGFLAASALTAWLVLWRAEVERLEDDADGVDLEHALVARRAEARAPAAAEPLEVPAK